MRWILDDTPFEFLASAVDPQDTAHWQSDVLLVAGTTAAAASPGRQALLDVRVDGKPVVAVFEVRIGAGGPAGQVLNELRPGPRSTTNLAEHESIAWAQVHGLDAVFVGAGWPIRSTSGWIFDSGAG